MENLISNGHHRHLEESESNNNYSTIIPQSVIDKCKKSIVHVPLPGAGDMKPRKYRAPSDSGSELATLEPDDFKSVAVVVTNTKSRTGTNKKNKIMMSPSPSPSPSLTITTTGVNGHGHGHSSTSSSGLVLTKNVGVGANLTITRGAPLSNSSRNAPYSHSHSSNSTEGQPILNSGSGQKQQSLSTTMITSTILPELLQHGRCSSSPCSNTSQAHLNKTQNLQPGLSKDFQPNKICSQNLNGTLAVTSLPSNDSELQLFRVLQRANLLNYFDVMIELGGDDVQQLCEAGEEEFLEIMALVGMASKPLHVRRLQKSLQEWMTQPSLFPGPILGPPLTAFSTGNQSPNPLTTAQYPESVKGPSHHHQHQLPIRPIPYHSANNSGNSNPSSSSSSSSPAYLNSNELKNLQLKFLAMRNSIESTMTITNPGHVPVNCESSRSNSSSPITSSASPNHPSQSPIPSVSPSIIIFPTPSPTFRQQQSRTATDQINPVPSQFPTQYSETRLQTGSPSPTILSLSLNTAESPQLDSRTSLSPIPFLQDHEIQKIIDAALKVVGNLPNSLNEPRVSKRKGSTDYENVIKLAEDDPRRSEEIRKYSPIYGRYDCKRKVQKPLTIHELSVNEAAAQLCSRVPGLLTRRDELFLLSRQVVRDAGLPYSSIIGSGSHMLMSQGQGKNLKTTPEQNDSSNSNSNSNASTDAHNNNSVKRMRLGDSEEYNRSRFELESDTSSQSQHSSCSGSELRNCGSPFELATSRFDSRSAASPGTSSSRGSSHGHNRRNSLEPDDLSIAKIIHDQSSNNCSSSSSNIIEIGSRSTSKSLRVKAEPR